MPRWRISLEGGYFYLLLLADHSLEYCTEIEHVINRYNGHTQIYNPIAQQIIAQKIFQDEP